MAYYCDDTPLRLTEGHAFDERWRPGERPMLSGLYRCACGLELPLPYGASLPTGEHRHQPSQGAAQWRLIIAAEEPAIIDLPARMKPAPPRANAREDLGA